LGLILNIETSTRVCSVALGRDGALSFVKETKVDRSHASSITVFIEEILSNEEIALRDLDAISVSKGPGSYTGLRIGVSTAKGLCYSLGIPLIAINSLKSIAQAYLSKNNDTDLLLCPMIDARRMEVYTAIYSNGLKLIEPSRAEIVNEKSFAEKLNTGKMIFIGEGSEKCKQLFEGHKNASFESKDSISARSMVPLSEKAFIKNKFEDVAYFEPFYLKDFVVGTPRRKM